MKSDKSGTPVKTVRFSLVLAAIILNLVAYSKPKSSNGENLTLDKFSLISNYHSNQNYLNSWLLKSTGLNLNIDANRINFSIEDYIYELNLGKITQIQILGPNLKDKFLVRTPTIEYFNDHVKIEFNNGWTHHIFITWDVVIYTINDGVKSTTRFFNIAPAIDKIVGVVPSTIQDYSVISITENQASIITLFQNNEGITGIKRGQLNLSTYKIVWSEGMSETKVEIKNSKEADLNVTARDSEIPKESQSVFTKVDVEASFPGGQSAWQQYLAKNINTQILVNKGAADGNYTVRVKFIVDSDGNLKEIQPESSNGYGMEEEAKRILEKSGKWIPAQLNGKNVSSYHRQLIRFEIQAQ